MVMDNHQMAMDSAMIKFSVFFHILIWSNMVQSCDLDRVPWPRDLEDLMEERMDDSFSWHRSDFCLARPRSSRRRLAS